MTGINQHGIARGAGSYPGMFPFAQGMPKRMRSIISVRIPICLGRAVNSALCSVASARGVSPQPQRLAQAV